MNQSGHSHRRQGIASRTQARYPFAFLFRRQVEGCECILMEGPGHRMRWGVRGATRLDAVGWSSRRARGRARERAAVRLRLRTGFPRMVGTRSRQLRYNTMIGGNSDSCRWMLPRTVDTQ